MEEEELEESPNASETHAGTSRSSEVPKKSSLDVIKECKSTSELLELDGLQRMIAEVFRTNRGIKLTCPDENCKEVFASSKLFFAHVKKYGQTPQPNNMRIGRASKRNVTNVVKFSDYDEYKDHPTNWACLSTEEQRDCVERKLSAHKGKPLKCLNSACNKKMKKIDPLIEHITECFLPEYFRYMTEPDALRSLQKKTREQIIRTALKVCGVLPCLNIHLLGCEYVSPHVYGLSYHMERCGVSTEEQPWKCYRCSFQGTAAESYAHREQCRRKETSELVESVEATESINLRPRKAAKRINVEDEGEEESGEDNSDDNDSKKMMLLGVPLTSTLNYKLGHRLDVSDAVLPTRRTARITVSGKRQRFKYKNWEPNANCPTNANKRIYYEAVRKARETFDRERMNEPLCSAVLDAQYEEWPTISVKELPDSCRSLLEKQSVPIALPSKTYSADSADECVAKRISVFDFEEMDFTVSERGFVSNTPDEPVIRFSGCATYCGGPIATISSCPRQFEDGKECVAVTVFPDEEYLVERTGDYYVLNDYIQLYTYKRNDQSVSATLSSVIETDVGTILCTTWCPALRGELLSQPKPGFQGFLAVAGMRGIVAVFSIHSTLLQQPRSKECPGFSRGAPAFRLFQPDKVERIPLIALAWSPFEGGSKLAAVSVSGNVLIWNANSLSLEAEVIPPSEGAGAPFSISFLSASGLTVGYREKSVRVYDLCTHEVIAEESSSRTAGAKIAAYPRLFSGIFCYQGDSITTTESVCSSCCYVAMGAGEQADEQNFFVIPMPNRHEIAMWDLAVCPTTGSLLTVGADGQLLLSLTGRLPPLFAKTEFPFNATRVLLLLKRKVRKRANPETEAGKRNLEFPTAEEGEASAKSDCRIPATDLESSAEQFFLEPSFNETVGALNLPQYSLDLRTESLNRVTISEASGKLAICGGEAGILFFIPFDL